MDKCLALPIPIHKGDKFSLTQCPHNDFEQKQMKVVMYVFMDGNIMYAQTCTQL